MSEHIARIENVTIQHEEDEPSATTATISVKPPIEAIYPGFVAAVLGTPEERQYSRDDSVGLTAGMSNKEMTVFTATSNRGEDQSATDIAVLADRIARLANNPLLIARMTTEVVFVS